MITDPYKILGVEPSANDEAIRAAYLSAIRDCPPDRDRLRFEQIRAAYEALETPRKRLEYALFDTTPPTREDVLVLIREQFVPCRPDKRALLRLLENR